MAVFLLTKEPFIMVNNNRLKQKPQIPCFLGNGHKCFTNDLGGRGRGKKICEAVLGVMVQQESRWGILRGCWLPDKPFIATSNIGTGQPDRAHWPKGKRYFCKQRELGSNLPTLISPGGFSGANWQTEARIPLNNLQNGILHFSSSFWESLPYAVRAFFVVAF